jgi:hypothetical protein
MADPKTQARETKNSERTFAAARHTTPQLGNRLEPMTATPNQAAGRVFGIDNDVVGTTPFTSPHSGNFQALFGFASNTITQNVHDDARQLIRSVPSAIPITTRLKAKGNPTEVLNLHRLVLPFASSDQFQTLFSNNF